MIKDSFKPIFIFHTFKTVLGLFVIFSLIIILSLPALVIVLLFDKERKLYLFCTRIFVRIFFWINLMPIDRMINLKDIGTPGPGVRRIYVLNHCSLVDGLLLFLMPGDIKFMANELYAKIPLFGLGLTMAGNISVKRTNDGQQMGLYYQAEEIVEKGYPLVIFPEGTRSKDGKIGRFQNSAFMLALEKKAEIVPVVLDTWNTFRPGGLMVRDNDVRMDILGRISYDDIKDLKYKEVSKLVRYFMLKDLVEHRDRKREKSPKYYRHFAPFKKLDDEMRSEIEALSPELEQVSPGILKKIKIT